MKTFVCLILAAGSLSGALAQEQAVWPDVTQRQSVRATKLIEPVFPQALLEQGVREGYATIILNISAEGQLADRLVSAYSHKPFADAALAVLPTWEFAPARLNGEPIGVVTEMKFSFEAGQVVISMDINNAFAALLNSFVPSQGYRLSTLTEIDRPPAPRVAASPLYTSSHVKNGRRGQVVFEFVIDEAGRVRLPYAVSGDDPELADLAGDALRRWEFEPPLREGRPVAVRARQVFNFEPKNAR
jgi:TonB family protein